MTIVATLAAVLVAITAINFAVVTRAVVAIFSLFLFLLSLLLRLKIAVVFKGVEPRTRCFDLLLQLSTDLACSAQVGLFLLLFATFRCCLLVYGDSSDNDSEPSRVETATNCCISTLTLQ